MSRAKKAATEQITLGVYVRKAFDIPVPADVYAILKCGGNAQETSARNSATAAVFDELFLFKYTPSTDETKADVLKLKLADDHRFRKDSTMGKATILLKDVLADPVKYRQGHVVELHSPADGKLQGRLEVQIFTESELPAGPLSVLCCTWNVGNAPPPENLSEWLRGVREGEHHVVAIAAQECSYKGGKEEGGAEAASHATVAVEPPSSSMDGTHTALDMGGAATPEEATPKEGAAAAAAAGAAKGAKGDVKVQNNLLARLHHKLKGTGFEWERAMCKAVGNQYWLLEGVNMGQIRLLVFVRVDIITAVDRTSIREDEEATGIAGVVNNKGGVGVSIRLFNTELAFISAHLAAHQDKLKERNVDYREIVKGVNLDAFKSDPVTAPHYTFWMGDLNYRIDFGGQATTFAETPTPEDWNALVAEVEKGAYAPLLEMDQLGKEMAAGRVFSGFKEAPITFAPTFKVVKKQPPGAKGEAYYMRKRSPAWCDRVLVRSGLPHLQATLGPYFSAPSIVTSDHKPVGCIAAVPIARSTLTSSRPGSSRGDAGTPSAVQYELVISNLASKDPWADMADEYDAVDAVINGPAVAASGTEVRLLPLAGTGGQGVLRKEVRALLKPGVLEDMKDERVLVKIEGLEAAGGIQSTLGTALLPLHDAVVAAIAAPEASTPFSIPVLKYGVPAGVLVGQVQVLVKGQAAAAAKKSSLFGLFKKK